MKAYSVITAISILILHSPTGQTYSVITATSILILHSITGEIAIDTRLCLDRQAANHSIHCDQAEQPSSQQQRHQRLSHTTVADSYRRDQRQLRQLP